MKICVIGTRGFPNIQGGIETHCEELYTRIEKIENCRIIVFRRKPYVKDKTKECGNIKFIDLWVPKNKYIETFLHSLFATITTIFIRPDIAHYHNTGPGVFIPILKLFRIKVVFTYHNISYTQKKWNWASKMFLNYTEKVSIKYSDTCIFISQTTRDIIINRYKISDYTIISNGVNKSPKSTNYDYIESLKLKPNKYILAIGRFLEEKGFDYLIDAYVISGVKDYKLVIAGDMDYQTSYSNKLKEHAKANNIILTGFIKGKQLQQIFTFAQLYIMSSFEEGLPITLLEAMSYNLDVLASNISANLEVGLNKDDYFEVGNTKALSQKIIDKLENQIIRNFDSKLNNIYNWDTISKSTYNLYLNTLNK